MIKYIGQPKGQTNHVGKLEDQKSELEMVEQLTREYWWL